MQAMRLVNENNVEIRLSFIKNNKLTSYGKREKFTFYAVKQILLCIFVAPN